MDSLNRLTALRVNSADQLPWDERCDLLIVGFGGAGACAAIEASTRGLSVLALDRFEGGGATALSGGVVYAGGGT
ncbi:delta 4, 5-alpha steroid dehydrogenase, partial [Pseudomonas jessenii]